MHRLSFQRSWEMARQKKDSLKMYDKLLLACLSASFFVTFPYYGDGGEKVAFSLISFLLIASFVFKPIRSKALFLPFIFLVLITWYSGQTTEIQVRFSFVNLILWIAAMHSVSNRINFQLHLLLL